MKSLNIIFLAIEEIDENNINDNWIYTSLLQQFIDEGHNVYILTSVEKRNFKHQKLGLRNVEGVNYLSIKTGNISKTNKIEKGISTLTIEKFYIRQIKKYLSDVKFDLVIYPTPPITFYKVIKYIKKRDGAYTYLMLKDIFPQNAVDLNFFSSKGIIYKYFRNKEKNLYKISDYIGCMSQANKDYLLKYNDYIKEDEVEIFPNSIVPFDLRINNEQKSKYRDIYDIPKDKIVFLYGGNLGKPQGIDFLLKCINEVKEDKDLIFLIIGNGTEYNHLVEVKNKLKLNNVIVRKRLPKKDFEKVASSSDVGILSLDYRFTIPNYPSRTLTYTQAGLPILAITDTSTDVGLDIEKNKFGWWCKEHSLSEFKEYIKLIKKEFNQDKLKEKSENSYNFLKDNFDVRENYKKILNHLED